MMLLIRKVLLVVGFNEGTMSPSTGSGYESAGAWSIPVSTSRVRVDSFITRTVLEFSIYVLLIPHVCLLLFAAPGNHPRCIILNI